MFALTGESRLMSTVLKTLTVVNNCTASTLEAMLALTQRNETVLEAAIYLTDSVTLFLSAVLKLNTTFRLMLLNVTTYWGGEAVRPLSNITDNRQSSRSTGSLQSLHHCGAALDSHCRDGFRATLWLVSALPQCFLSVWSTILALSKCIPAAVSLLLVLMDYGKPTLSSMLALCGWISPVLYHLPSRMLCTHQKDIFSPVIYQCFN